MKTIERIEGDNRLLITKVDPYEVPEFPLGDALRRKKGSPPDQDINASGVALVSAANLPGIHKRDSKFWDPDVETAYKKMYHGHDLTIVTHFRKPEGLGGMKSSCVVMGIFGKIDVERISFEPKDIFDMLHVALERKQPKEIGVMAYLLNQNIDSTWMEDCEETSQQPKGWVLLFGFREDPPNPIGILNTNPLGTALYKLLTWDQRIELNNRFVHLFLRYQGSMLAEETFHSLAEACNHHYVINDAFWAENLDMCLVQANTAYSNHHSIWSVVALVYKAGEVLECQKQFQKASLLYQEAVHLLSPDEGFYLSGLYNAAGLASKRAQNFAQAEALYVKALHYDLIDNGMDWGRVCPDYVKNILFMYDDWIDLHDRFDIVALLFFGLLVAAKANRDQDIDKQEVIYLRSLEGFNSLTDTLKPIYRRKKEAEKTLTEAVSRPDDVEHFRSTIAGCVRSNYSCRLLEAPDTKEDRKKAFHRDAKDTAREFLTSHARGISISTMVCKCENCNVKLSNDKLKHCPCKTVYYCDTNCQRGHWKHHKMVCPWLKTKNEQK